MVKLALVVVAVCAGAVLVEHFHGLGSADSSGESPLVENVGAPDPETAQAGTEAGGVTAPPMSAGEQSAAGSEAQAGAGDDAPSVVVDSGEPSLKVYTYKVVAEHPHDKQDFIQGFLPGPAFCDTTGVNRECRETFYQSTGGYGKSSVRLADRETGETILMTRAGDEYFGEGLTQWGDKLLQLTWKKPTVLIYDAQTLAKLGQGSTGLRDGWGLTNDSRHLIATDSGHKLHFLDPETLQVNHSVGVTFNGTRVKYLNELEYVDGQVWANVWLTPCIAQIDPASGEVRGWIELSGLKQLEVDRDTHREDVLNGIAWDPKARRLWVTGKLWSTVYEIELVEVKPTEDDIPLLKSTCMRG